MSHTRDDGPPAGAEDETAFVALGEPHPAAEAAYLEHELGRHGIEARLRAADPPGPDLVIEVRATDLEAGAAVFRGLLETTEEPPVDRTSIPHAGGRRRALLAAATGAVAVLYVGRALPGAFHGVLAVVVGAGVYLAVSARTKARQARLDPSRPASDPDDP